MMARVPLAIIKERAAAHVRTLLLHDELDEYSGNDFVAAFVVQFDYEDRRLAVDAYVEAYKQFTQGGHA